MISPRVQTTLASLDDLRATLAMLVSNGLRQSCNPPVVSNYTIVECCRSSFEIRALEQKVSDQRPNTLAPTPAWGGGLLPPLYKKSSIKLKLRTRRHIGHASHSSVQRMQTIHGTRCGCELLSLLTDADLTVVCLIARVCAAVKVHLTIIIEIASASFRITLSAPSASRVICHCSPIDALSMQVCALTFVQCLAFRASSFRRANRVSVDCVCLALGSKPCTPGCWTSLLARELHA